MKVGIQFAKELGKQRVELEVDAKNVWRSISEGEQAQSYGGNILKDTFVFSSSFSSFKCNYVPRQCNRVANTLPNATKDI